MFGYVSQGTFDREVKAREKAEAARDTAREAQLKAEASNKFLSALCKQHETRINDLLGERDEERAHNKNIQESRLKETALLLAHIAPLEPEHSSPDRAPNQPITYEQIMAEPATTKREMALRQLRANRAREEQMSEDVRQKIAERDALLSAEEKDRMRDPYDAVLGVRLPNEMQQEGEISDHAN